MSRKVCLQLLFFFFGCFFQVAHGRQAEPPPSKPNGNPMAQTLIISFDAFRWDYVYRIRDMLSKEKKESNFWKIINGAAFAKKGVFSVFSTLTFPAHYSIATGLYEENTGIVGDNIYDPILNRSANLMLNLPENTWAYNKGEPIWNTIRQQTKKEDSVGCIMWIGCYAFNLKYFVPWNFTEPVESRMDTAINWLNQGKQLVLLYYQEPDVTGHPFGPDSIEMDKQLLLLDNQVGYLIKILEENHLENINLIILADHGMITIRDRMLLNHKQPADMFYIRSEGQVIDQVQPMEGRYEETKNYFSQFKGVNTIEKEHMPEQWHYKHNERIMPLVILADPGIALNTTDNGTHGYDNFVQDMRPFFIARGPAFIANAEVGYNMSLVDVYLLLCTLLNLKPSPNNGTVDHFRNFVNWTYIDQVIAYQKHEAKADEQAATVTYGIIAFFIVLVIVVLLGLLIFALLRNRIPALKSKKEQYQSLS